jgi:hypothetical protein
VGGVEYTNGPGFNGSGFTGSGLNGSGFTGSGFNGTGSGLPSSGSFNGVLGGPNSAMPNNAAPGAHGLNTGANPAAAALNPNEMPPPAAAAGPNNTMTAGSTSGVGAAGAGAGHGGADRLVARRGFDPGVGAGNGSWLAEPEPAMPSSVSSGAGTARRRDFKAQVRVTENVTVDGEDVALSERVIGRRDDDQDR